MTDKLSSGFSFFDPSGAHALGAGFVTSVLLLLGAAVTAVEFARVAGTGTGLLLAPYLVWLSYASVLNLRLLQLNKK